MFEINPQLSWRGKAGVIVVFLNFDFYFFRKLPAKWFKQILSGDKNFKEIPSDFIDYLSERKILK